MHWLIAVVISVVAVTLLVASLANIAWMLHYWRDDDASTVLSFPKPFADTTLHFSLLVPARHEEAVLERTLDRLLRSDHPEFEVIVIVGDDDPATRAVAERVADSDVRVRIAVDSSPIKNKPRALNAGLPLCNGDVVGVFDAEDDVHPELLSHIEACFRTSGADVVQGPVQLMNFRSSWYAVQNVLEYFFWFKSRLHLQAQRGFFPLAGNTVFIRRDVLESEGGWDPDCLAEDCELGVRLTSKGARVVVAYDAAMATREEVPASLRELLLQRSRWNQGFLQTLRKGDWRKLPSVRQRVIAVATLMTPFTQALLGLLFPCLILSFFVHVPVQIAMLAWTPALVTVATIVARMAGLHDFCRSYGQKASARDYLRLVIGTIPYQAVLGYAALRAVWREGSGDREWHKTSHSGLHRSLDDEGEGLAALPARKPIGWSQPSCGFLPDTTVAQDEPVAIRTGRSRFGLWLVLSGLTAYLLSIRQSHVKRAAQTAVVAAAAATVLKMSSTWKIAVVDPVPGTSTEDPPFDGRLAMPRRWPREPAKRILVPNSSSEEATSSAMSLARLWAWLSRRWIDCLLVAVVVIIGGYVHAHGMLHSPGFDDDEGTYVAQAFAAQQWHRLGHYTYWYDHPPLGWLLLAAWNMIVHIGHDLPGVPAAREMILATQIASAALLFAVCRRLGVSSIGSFFIVGLFSLSPLAVHFQRMVFLDNIATPFLLSSFFFAASPRRRLSSVAAAGVCLALSVLIKETTLLFLPGVTWLIWRGKARRPFVLAVFASCVCGVVALYPLFAALKGELVPDPGHVSLLGAVKWQLFDRAPSGSVFDPSSDARHTIDWWLSMDRVLPVAAVAACPFGLVVRRIRPMAAVLLLQLAMLLRNGYLPIPFVIAVIPFASIVIVASVDAFVRTLWRWCGQRRSTPSRSCARTAMVVACLTLVALSVAALVRSWEPGDSALLFQRADLGYQETLDWVEANVPRNATILVDDTFWADLVEAGYRPTHIVWFYKFDLDPAIKRRFPDGAVDIDYVVSTGIMRAEAHDLPRVRATLNSSAVLAQFGAPTNPIVVREVTVGSPSSRMLLPLEPPWVSWRL